MEKKSDISNESKKKQEVEKFIYDGIMDVLKIYGASSLDRRDDLSDRMADRIKQLGGDLKQWLDNYDKRADPGINVNNPSWHLHEALRYVNEFTPGNGEYNITTIRSCLLKMIELNDPRYREDNKARRVEKS